MCVRACLSLVFAAGSLLFMTNRQASSHVLFMATLVAMPGGHRGPPEGMQTLQWMVDDPV